MQVVMNWSRSRQSVNITIYMLLRAYLLDLTESVLRYRLESALYESYVQYYKSIQQRRSFANDEEMRIYEYQV